MGGWLAAWRWQGFLHRNRQANFPLVLIDEALRKAPRRECVVGSVYSALLTLGGCLQSFFIKLSCRGLYARLCVHSSTLTPVMAEQIQSFTTLVLPQLVLDTRIRQLSD